MGDDDILHFTFIDDLSDKDAKTYREDVMSFAEATIEAEPLPMFVDSSRLGKVSPVFRKVIVELLRDPRIGKMAAVGANRYARVLATFFTKATGRDDARFFDSEEEALTWLKANRS
jgi:hypothetical protein